MCVTKKVILVGEGENHEEAIHEGHGLNGAVAPAYVPIDNCNCIVINTWAVPNKNGGLPGELGLASHTPDCKGHTVTECEDPDADEDITPTSAPEVGGEES